MIKTIISVVILTLTLTVCNGQTEKEEIEKATNEAIKDWFENPSMDNEVLDPNIMDQFQDSGRMENGLKTGLWIEYSLDSSLRNQTTILVVGDKILPTTFSDDILKKVGEYLKNNKVGTWTTYELIKLHFHSGKERL